MDILSMVRPYEDDKMAAYTISRDFNSKKIKTNTTEVTTAVGFDGLRNVNQWVGICLSLQNMNVIWHDNNRGEMVLREKTIIRIK
jgi:uncharacterized protein (UPF0297 family)